jgi:hypothetical protein
VVFAVFVIALVMTLLSLTRVQVADRRAARYLTLHAAARRPERAGDAYGCRNCGAPLMPQSASAGVVSRCVYCEADNVLGLDLRREAMAAEPERRAVERALEQRADERRAGWWQIGVAAGVIVLCIVHWIPQEIPSIPAAWDDALWMPVGLLISLFPSVTLVVAPVSAVWVYSDARRLNNDLMAFGKSSFDSLSGKTPGRWAAGCFFLWVWYLPAYLLARRKVKNGMALFLESHPAHVAVNERGQEDPQGEQSLAALRAAEPSRRPSPAPDAQTLEAPPAEGLADERDRALSKLEDREAEQVAADLKAEGPPPEATG